MARSAILSAINCDPTRDLMAMGTLIGETNATHVWEDPLSTPNYYERVPSAIVDIYLNKIELFLLSNSIV